MNVLAWSLFEALARNWALVVILSTALSLVIVPALVILKYVRISLGIMRSTKPPLSRNPLDFERVIGQEVRFLRGGRPAACRHARAGQPGSAPPRHDRLHP